MSANQLKREQKKYLNYIKMLKDLKKDISNDNLPQSLNEDSKNNFIEFSESLQMLCKRCVELLESDIDDLENE